MTALLLALIMLLRILSMLKSFCLEMIYQFPWREQLFLTEKHVQDMLINIRQLEIIRKAREEYVYYIWKKPNLTDFLPTHTQWHDRPHPEILVVRILLPPV